MTSEVADGVKKILAHRILYCGKVYEMSVATIAGGRVVAIEPYVRETEGTVFISGTVSLVPRGASIEVVTDCR